ncbi:MULTISPECIES: hypothetical protein [Methylobacterium]|jgi:hypothetical protein|uniref:Uncharacterized protein n=1 Tax=Methylobacterium hispanicum TaxID=270350 RepID=A0AAV4ZNX0_9HYPH|nr:MULTISPECIES: hypothetical protein [Methylobacterium]GJD90172.1 hypothetical protein BHAOGJBA_3707 [Methylobacterium hispanicum]
MRHAYTALLLTCAATAASAQGRPDSTTMTCAQARATVLRAGGIVLGTGGPTYDRYVRDRNFCAPTEVTRAGFVPTRDAPRCFVGYTCFEPGVGDWFGDY